MALQRLFTEPSTNFTDSLVLLRVGVVTCKEESTIDVGAFAFTVVTADDYEVEGVADAC